NGVGAAAHRLRERAHVGGIDEIAAHRRDMTKALGRNERLEPRGAMVERGDSPVTRSPQQDMAADEARRAGDDHVLHGASSAGLRRGAGCWRSGKSFSFGTPSLIKRASGSPELPSVA